MRYSPGHDKSACNSQRGHRTSVRAGGQHAADYRPDLPRRVQTDRLGRVNTDDGRWSIWVVSWVAHALTSQPWRVFDANIFYPERQTLAYSEANLLAGLVGIPPLVGFQPGLLGGSGDRGRGEHGTDAPVLSPVRGPEL